jgi:hypothetical protein
MLSESGLRGDETAFVGGSRIFGVRCVFASLFGEALFCTAPEINPVFYKANKFNDHRSVITMSSNEGYRIARRQNVTVA